MEYESAAGTLAKQNGPLQLRYLEIQRRLHENGKGTQERELLDARDAGALARLTGTEVSEMEALVAAMYTDPWGAAAEEYLPKLRAELGTLDFDAVKRYLLDVVAAQMGDFIEEDH